MIEKSNAEKLAANVSLILISRAAMIVATLALPVAGWFVSRGVSTVDTISANVSGMREQIGEVNAALRLIQQSSVSQDKVLNDHEGRIRTLESYARNTMPNASAIPR